METLRMAQQVRLKTLYDRRISRRVIGFVLVLSFLHFLLSERHILTAFTQEQGSPSHAQSEKEALPLEPGKPIERELSGGQTHYYRVKVEAGQYLHLVVDQRGIDVVVTLSGPEGKKLLEVD